MYAGRNEEHIKLVLPERDGLYVVVTWYLIFTDLRDRECEPCNYDQSRKQLAKKRYSWKYPEKYVVEVTGLVEAREQANPNFANRSSRTQGRSYYGSQYCQNNIILKSRTELKPMMILGAITAT